MRSIELLSPARNLECGTEAIRHGADAVYIGAPRFGARAAAGNSIDDIAALVRYAHPFGVRIYVTLNTLLYDDELPAAQALINDLGAIHVDALITQDPRITYIGHSSNYKLPNCPISSPIPLHSSTQMDNRTVADVRARLADGYEQTVLARELSLDDIRAIHTAVPEMSLEAFVHGALCVCYSGRCYASEHLFGRSANRGECAQFCRLPFDLIDDKGRIVTVPEGSPSGNLFTLKPGTPLRQRHLLSLRDMNRAAELEAMMDAGVSSFKIEGRLKDVSYVKNTTAYYRQCIDAIIKRRHKDFCRASYGNSVITFTPDLSRSFNRGFTDYFIHTPYGCDPNQRPSSLANFATPKSLGQFIGTVKAVSVSGGFPTRKITSPSHPSAPSPSPRVPHPSSPLTTRPSSPLNTRSSFSLAAAVLGAFPPSPPSPAAPYLTLSTPAPLANGDGLCFFSPDGHLQGFRVNRVDAQGHIYPADPAILAVLRKGTPLYRNLDAAFEQQLSRPTADRRLHLRWTITDTPPSPPSLTPPSHNPSILPPPSPDSSTLPPNSSTLPLTFPPSFTLTAAVLGAFPPSPPPSPSITLTFPYPHEPARTPQADNIRRQLARLGGTIYETTPEDIHIHFSDNWFIPASTLADWRREIVKLLDNRQTESTIPLNANRQDKFHIPLTNENPSQEDALMTCRYCLRHELGACLRTPSAKKLPPHLALRLTDGRTFPLRFNCDRCEMLLIAP